MDEHALGAELRELGASLPPGGPDPDAVAVAVLDRIAAEDVAGSAPAARRQPSRRARLVAATAAVVVALGVTPPVRAALGEWLGIGGVVVRPGPSQPSASAPPTAAGLTMDQARELVPFEPAQPARLGPPDGVEVTADGRLLTLTWGNGTNTVRLDQFDGRPSPLFVKTATVGEAATLVELGDTDAWWFAEPHDLELLDDGDGPPRPIRVAGPTLVWVADGVTLRLEGLEREHAVAIARSTLGTG